MWRRAVGLIVRKIVEGHCAFTFKGQAVEEDFSTLEDEGATVRRNISNRSPNNTA